MYTILLLLDAAAQVCTEPRAPLRLFAADGHAVSVAATATSQPGGLESGGGSKGSQVGGFFPMFFYGKHMETLGPVHWRNIVSRGFFFFRGAKSEESEWWWDSGESPRKVMV